MESEFGKRMKLFEGLEAGRHLIPLLPVISRIDGRCFHSFTKGLERPFDGNFYKTMIETTKHLVEESGALIGYVQSDEISLVWQAPNFNSQIFFNGRIMKMTSVLASIATARFNSLIPMLLPAKRGNLATFDCRVWNVPSRTEAANTILWRERDATKNAISMAARSMFSHMEVSHKTGSEMQEMMFRYKAVNFDKYPAEFKRGTFVQRKNIKRRFTSEEIGKLPSGHEARKNPNLEIERRETLVLSEMFGCGRGVPSFSKVKNREGFIFEGEDPVVEDCQTKEVLQ